MNKPVLSQRKMKDKKEKTLKDFDWDIYKPKKFTGGQKIKIDLAHIIVIKQLKREAIEWIKKFQYIYPSQSDCQGMKKFYAHYQVNADAKNLIEWIKHFFNIKEDELKD